MFTYCSTYNVFQYMIHREKIGAFSCTAKLVIKQINSTQYTKFRRSEDKLFIKSTTHDINITSKRMSVSSVPVGRSRSSIIKIAQNLSLGFANYCKLITKVSLEYLKIFFSQIMIHLKGNFQFLNKGATKKFSQIHYKLHYIYCFLKKIS